MINLLHFSGIAFYITAQAMIVLSIYILYSHLYIHFSAKKFSTKIYKTLTLLCYIMPTIITQSLIAEISLCPGFYVFQGTGLFCPSRLYIILFIMAFTIFMHIALFLTKANHIHLHTYSLSSSYIIYLFTGLLRKIDQLNISRHTAIVILLLSLYIVCYKFCDFPKFTLSQLLSIGFILLYVLWCAMIYAI